MKSKLKLLAAASLIAVASAASAAQVIETAPNSAGGFINVLDTHCHSDGHLGLVIASVTSDGNTMEGCGYVVSALMIVNYVSWNGQPIRLQPYAYPIMGFHLTDAGRVAFKEMLREQSRNK